MTESVPFSSDVEDRESEWKAQYNTGFPEIDEQHKGFFKIVNNIYSLIEDDKDPPKEKVKEMLNGLANYADSHFSTEEEYFLKYGYEKANQHVGHHDAFRAQIRNFIEQYSSENESNRTLLEKILQYANFWFSAHILEEDKKYKWFFESKGIATERRTNDRRSEVDRRKIHDVGYFEDGGTERRRLFDRRRSDRREPATIGVV